MVAPIVIQAGKLAIEIVSQSKLWRYLYKSPYDKIISGSIGVGSAIQYASRGDELDSVQTIPPKSTPGIFNKARSGRKRNTYCWDPNLNRRVRCRPNSHSYNSRSMRYRR